MSEVIIAALVSAAAAIVVGLINSRAQHNKLIAELDKRDELQAVIAFLREQDYGVPLQYTNYR